MALKDVKDLERPEGLLRQLFFSNNELAVVDVSAEVLTVNWTTECSALEFATLTSRLPHYHAADAIVCTPDDEVETDVEGLIGLVAEERPFVPGKWDLVRLDVSDTRSVAWERMPDGAAVVGFGDTADCLYGSPTSEAAGDLVMLLELTGTSHIDFHSVVDNALELAKLWHDRTETDSLEKPLAKAETNIPKTSGFKEWYGYDEGL